MYRFYHYAIEINFLHFCNLYWTSQIGQESHSPHRVPTKRLNKKNKHRCNCILNEWRGNVKAKAGQPSPRFLSQLCGKAVADL